jgi:glycine cleavage system H protein
MIAISALLVLVIILMVEIWREWHTRQCDPLRSTEQVEMGTPAAGARRYFHPGHSWALVERTRLVSVGIDDFASRFIGRVESVEMMAPGAVLQQGEPFVTLRHGRRSLTLAAPLSGILMDVNSRLAVQPALVSDSPYDSGWIAKFAPARLSVDLRNLATGPIARRWRESAQEKLSHWFAPGMGTVLQDGGQLSAAVGELLSDKDWDMLVKILFPLRQSSEKSGLEKVTG